MTGNLRFAIGDYIGRYPDVQFDGIEGGIEKLFAGLQAHSVDAAITPMAFSEPGIDKRGLRTDRLMLAVRDGHPTVEASPLHWTALRCDVLRLPPEGLGPGIGTAITPN